MDDLIAEFIAETNESIAHFETEILNSKNSSDDTNLITSISRLMYIVQSTYDSLGLWRLENMACSREADYLLTEALNKIKGLLALLKKTSTESTEDNNSKTEQILLVENSSFFRKLITPLFIENGFVVRTATNGLEAICILQEVQDFKLIITDIDMPEMNGLKFAESCKGDKNLSHIPIIALTANASHYLDATEKGVGIVAYVSKQDRAGLLTAVAKALENDIEYA